MNFKASFVAAVLAAVMVAVPDARAQNHPALDATGVQPHRDSFSEAPFEHIDTLSGSLVLTFTDLVLRSNAGRELRFQRTYNSKTNRWTFGIAGLALTLSDPPMPLADTPDVQEATPALHLSDGAVAQMAWLNTPNINSLASLRFARSRHFWTYDRTDRVLRTPEGMLCTYDQDPDDEHARRLHRCTDPFGNVISLAWTATSLEIRQTLSETESRLITLARAPGPFFPTSMTFAGRTWTYEAGRVTPPAGPPWAYTYTEMGLTRVRTPRGGEIDYTYDNQPYEGPDPGTQYFTKVVRTRATGGRLPAGTWTYDYVIAQDGLSGQTTVTSPLGHRTIHTHGSVTSTEDTLDGAAGTIALVERRVQHSDGQGWVDLEVEARHYVGVPVLGWFPFVTPELQTRTLTRYAGGASRPYTTAYTYRSTDFGDYHRPWRVTETGDEGHVRTTTRTYAHFPDPFIVGLMTEEVVEARTGTFRTAWSYDGETGFLTRATAYGLETTYEADVHGNVHAVTNGNGHTTFVTYQYGLASEIRTPHHTTRRVIHEDGTVRSETQAGRTTTFEYDNLSRLTKTQPPGGAHPILVDYDNVSGATVTTRRGASELVTTVDGFGRPIATRTSVHVRTTTRYDAEGRTTYEGYPFLDGGSDIGAEIAYDALGRVTRRDNPGPTFSTYTYGLGSLTSTDENGRPTVHTREAYGDPDDAWLTQLTDAASKLWIYSYNGLGQLTRVTAPDGIQRHWVYQPGSNRLESESHPESGLTRYRQYDGAGNLAWKTDANGTDVLYAYDGNERLTTLTAGGEITTVTYERDSDNRQTMAGAGAATTFSYDPLTGHLRSRTDVVGGLSLPTFYRYDGHDRVDRISYPSGREVGYEYDTEGRLLRVFDATSGRTYASDVTYHPSGAVTQYRTGDGTLHALTYDPDRYWPLTITSGALDLSYEDYDGVGNVRTIRDGRDPDHPQTFTYDALDRLHLATGPQWSLRYEYDEHGNRVSIPNGTTYTYDPQTRRLATQDQVTFQYDANGNVTSISGQQFTYTPHNMLRTVDGPVTSFTYDADQSRVSKTSGGVTTVYVRGPGNALLTEWQDPGQPTETIRDYIYAGTRLVAVVRR